MAKTLKGVVISTKMTQAVVVEVTRKIPHPKYKKLLTRSKKYRVAVNGHDVQVGDTVSIAETRPLSKTIHHVISGKDQVKAGKAEKTVKEKKVKEEKV